MNIVPQYLPRYGMAPEWARSIRPLVLIYVAIAFVITAIFRASVDEQAVAYATGVLAMMTSAAFAVSLSAWRRGSGRGALSFGTVTLVFVYAFVANEIQRLYGIMIASSFILAIVNTSLVSRVWRTTELRTEKIEVDETARRFIDEASGEEATHIIANRRQTGDARDYHMKEREQRECTLLPADASLLFLRTSWVTGPVPPYPNNT